MAELKLNASGEPVCKVSFSVVYDAKPGAMKAANASFEESEGACESVAASFVPSAVESTGSSSILSMSASNSSNCRRVGCRDGDDEVDMFGSFLF